MEFGAWWIEYRGFDDWNDKPAMKDCWNAAVEECIATVSNPESLDYRDQETAEKIAELLRTKLVK